jgi:hypothetical protein
MLSPDHSDWRSTFRDNSRFDRRALAHRWRKDWSQIGYCTGCRSGRSGY